MKQSPATYSQVVSHEWERASALRALRSGAIMHDEVCDADFLLRAAAKHHGTPANRSCPVCDNDDMKLTRWVYGESLGRRAGSARSEEEIADFIAEGIIFTVHHVEVCTQCGWNYLLQTATAHQ